MNNKQIGFIITSFAFLLGIVIYFFNRALSQIVETSCDHGSSCPMWGSISFHTNITVALMIIVLGIGLYFIFFGDRIEKSKSKRELENNKLALNDLNPDEKLIIDLINAEQGTIFQSQLVEKSDFNKVKITRILDKLEGKALIERKRRGMTNVIILKHQN